MTRNHVQLWIESRFFPSQFARCHLGVAFFLFLQGRRTFRYDLAISFLHIGIVFLFVGSSEATHTLSHTFEAKLDLYLYILPLFKM
jgi:hypothetical protein